MAAISGHSFNIGPYGKRKRKTLWNYKPKIKP